MTDISQLRERVKTLLHDSAGTGWSDDEIDEAIRMALAEYNRFSPKVHTAVVEVGAAGREISLESLAGLRTVTSVFWPYREGEPGENLLAGYRITWDDSIPALLLSAYRGRLPQVGDQAKVWYTLAHTISGLDGETETTILADDESLIVLGACGYAAAGASIDRSEVIALEHLSALSKRLLETFRMTLDKHYRTPARSAGQPWEAGWKMDGWDGRYAG